MAYHYTTTQGKEYILRVRAAKLRDGRQRNLYYFSPVKHAGRSPSKSAVLPKELPKGYQVRETRHGLPVVQPVNPPARAYPG